MTARFLRAALGCIAMPTALLAQRVTLTGVVVSNATREPLAYAVVALPELGREQFTSDSGAFTFADLPPGPVHLKVRRLGYAPSDITIPAAEGMPRVTIELAHIAVRLGSVIVRAYPPCTTPGPPAPSADSSLATVFSQLRMNADQLRVLSNEYPFVSQMDALRAHKDRDGKVAQESRAVMLIQSVKQWRYKPGAVVSPSGAHDYVFNIPTLLQFADDRFVNLHCFHYAGIDTVNDLPVARLDVVAARSIEQPDVDGSLYLDPDTYQIRRSVLRLTRFPSIKAMSGYEITTDFDELMESIPVISRVFAVQSYDTTNRGRDYDAIYEHWQLLGVKFVGKKPGKQKPTTSPP